jgi:iron-sulfur cluster assembly protein
VVEVTIVLTEKAAQQIRKSIERRGKGLGLRVGVKKVGCSGFAYTFDYADEVGANDALFESHEAKVVVDHEALQYLDGSTLDYVREGLKESFKFENPNVKAQCGCGESFSV